MKPWLAVAAANGALAVAAGAFAAHGLSGALPPDSLAIFETAARYQMYHGLALGLCGLAPREMRIGFPAWSFVAGIILFCGSLYGLALTGVRPLAYVTPAGGAAFLIGWVALAWSALRKST